MKEFHLILIGLTLLITGFNVWQVFDLRSRQKRADRERDLRALGQQQQQKSTFKPWLPTRDGPAPSSHQ